MTPLYDLISEHINNKPQFTDEEIMNFDIAKIMPDYDKNLGKIKNPANTEFNKREVLKNNIRCERRKAIYDEFIMLRFIVLNREISEVTDKMFDIEHKARVKTGYFDLEKKFNNLSMQENQELETILIEMVALKKQSTCLIRNNAEHADLQKQFDKLEKMRSDVEYDDNAKKYYRPGFVVAKKNGNN